MKVLHLVSDRISQRVSWPLSGVKFFCIHQALHSLTVNSALPLDFSEFDSSILGLSAAHYETLMLDNFGQPQYGFTTVNDIPIKTMSMSVGTDPRLMTRPFLWSLIWDISGRID